MKSGLKQRCGGNFLAIFAGMVLGEKSNFLSQILDGEGRSILVQTGYNLSSRNLIWDIGRVGLAVSHNSVNNGNHLPAGMAPGCHVGLPFISFF